MTFISSQPHSFGLLNSNLNSAIKPPRLYFGTQQEKNRPDWFPTDAGTSKHVSTNSILSNQTPLAESSQPFQYKKPMLIGVLGTMALSILAPLSVIFSSNTSSEINATTQAPQLLAFVDESSAPPSINSVNLEHSETIQTAVSPYLPEIVSIPPNAFTETLEQNANSYFTTIYGPSVQSQIEEWRSVIDSDRSYAGYLAYVASIARPSTQPYWHDILDARTTGNGLDNFSEDQHRDFDAIIAESREARPHIGI